MQFADRISPLAHNVFADIDRAKSKLRNSGQSIIDLSLGSSDLPTSPHILEAIGQSLHDPDTHGYLLFNRTQHFRQAAAHWYEKRYGIAVDPETEVLPLIGSQEGTAHLPLAVLNPGDYALLLDPGYPSHSGGVHLAGGQIYPMAIREETGFLPVLSDIPPAVLAQAKLMVLSYPHNPTGAIAPLDFFKDAVTFCQTHGIVLAHDFPYGDLVFRDDPVPSIFQADPTKSCTIEFFTMSKSYNMGGFRMGYAIGNVKLITALRQIKATVDFNQYLGILNGASLALTGPQTCVMHTVETFRHRMDTFVNALQAIGWQVRKPEAAMYVWAKLPEAYPDSMKFCLDLLDKTGVAASPGIGFGAAGEGYVRFALVHDPAVLQEAVDRMARFPRMGYGASGEA